MIRSFNSVENFPLGGACAQPRRHLGFWHPLIRQEVIKIESSNFGHSSFTTVENFIRIVGVFAPPRNVKTMGNIEDSIVISR